MTTATQLPAPRAVFYDANGDCLSGGYVHTYVAGGGTTPKVSWQDAAETVPNSNPIVLDSAGSCLLYGSGTYTLAVTDAVGNAIPAYSGTTADTGLPTSLAMVPVTSAVTLSSAMTALGITPAMQAVVAQTTLPAGLALLNGLAISAGVGSVATIAALRLLSGTIPPVVVVEGYAAAGDGGGGVFVYVATDTTSADNVGLIVVGAGGRRWYRDTQGQPLRLSWFGGGPAAADNAAAWNLAITAGGSAICMHFPSGTYTFSVGVGLTMPNSTASVTLTGDGPDMTKLLFTTGGIGVMLISPNNSVHVRDLSLLAGSIGVATALAITQNAAVANPANSALSNITNVSIRGSDGLALTNYFSSGVTITGASNINFVNLFVTGASTHNVGFGVYLTGSAATIPVLFNFTGCVFNYLNVGINYGSYVQGVSVSQCNFTYDNYGIFCPAALINLAQLAVTDSQFNCFLFAVETLSNPAGFSIADNFILVPNNGVGLRHEQAGLFAITGNTFFALASVGTTGIQIATSTGFGVVTGNAFVALATRAVSLEATSSNVNVQSNSYQACGANVVNAGAGNTVGGGSP